ncbi:MAG TPA: hypothetical protein VFS93_04680 [Terrimesophilobacter sp.]|nr:hypothetical protein [Terrimesophilobacter sp.]
MDRYLDDRPTVAYAVPFWIDRSRAPRYELTNVGSEPVRAITLTLLGSGLMLSNAPRRLLPGQSLRFTVRVDNAARNTIVVVRWFRPSGEQYLWRVSF